MNDFLLSVLVWLMAAAGLWLVLRTIVSRLSGLRWRPVDTGPVLRTSRWGDAEVNGTGFQESVRVLECPHGWLVEAHWALGGGRLWLPRDQTRVGSLERGGRRSGAVRILEAGRDRVRLEGELAEFVAEPVAAPDPAT
jgi:hypothetical protein